jgi:WD40 repeat protein
MASIHGFSFGAFVVEAAFLGSTAIFALGDGTVRLVNGGAAKEVKVHSGAILSAEVTREGALLTGGDDGLVAMVDATGTIKPVSERPKKWIDAVAAGPSGAVAFSFGKQAVVRFAYGRERTFEQASPVGGLAFAPKGMRLAVVGNDGATLWWAATDGAPVRLNRAGAHIGASFSPDGRYLMTALQENTLHGWRLENAQDFRMSGYTAKPKSLSWSAKGRYLASSGSTSAILWPFLTKDGPVNKTPLQLGARDVPVTRVACHPKDDVVAVGYRDGLVLLARFADRQEAKLRQGGERAVSALAFDDAGTRLVFGTEDGAAGVIDLEADPA